MDRHVLAARVERARDIQTRRLTALGAPDRMRLNAHAEGKILESICSMDPAAEALMKYLKGAKAKAIIKSYGYDL